MPDPLGPDDPRRLGGYTLVRRLAGGGQGTAYLGKGDDGQHVTVEVLRAGPRAGARSAREATTATQVDHRHVARLLDTGLDADRPYLVSEYVDGPSLQRTVRAEGPITGPELRKLALRCAAGLAALHRGGVLHRDLKPANVLLGPGGPKITGFGVPRRADPGTAAFMSPEQIEEEPVGAPSDVFSWASTVVFAATGRPPFGPGTEPAVRRRVVERAPELGGPDVLDAALREIVLRALDKNPAARPTAAQIVRRLREKEASPAPARSRRMPAYRRNMMLALGAVVAFGFILGILLS